MENVNQILREGHGGFPCWTRRMNKNLCLKKYCITPWDPPVSSFFFFFFCFSKNWESGNLDEIQREGTVKARSLVSTTRVLPNLIVGTFSINLTMDVEVKRVMMVKGWSGSASKCRGGLVSHRGQEATSTENWIFFINRRPQQGILWIHFISRYLFPAKKTDDTF